MAFGVLETAARRSVLARQRPQLFVEILETETEVHGRRVLQHQLTRRGDLLGSPGLVDGEHGRIIGCFSICRDALSARRRIEQKSPAEAGLSWLEICFSGRREVRRPRRLQAA
jgi:hypothetical protein